MKTYFRYLCLIIITILCVQFVYFYCISDVSTSNPYQTTEIKPELKRFIKNNYYYKLNSSSCVNEIHRYETRREFEINNLCPNHKLYANQFERNVRIDLRKLVLNSVQKYAPNSYLNETCVDACRNCEKRYSFRLDATCYCLSREQLDAIRQSGVDSNNDQIRTFDIQDGGEFQLSYGITNRPDSSTKPAKICYLLMLNGRDIIGVFSLFQRIYLPRNHYFIHIDQRQEFLRDYLLRLTSRYRNVHVFSWSVSTIWGGTSLLQVYRKAMEEIVFTHRNVSWDFIVNLSESDFLLKDPNELALFLGANLDRNFLHSSGESKERFINKQGLRMLFVECDNRLYRIGQRKLPSQLLLDGGSDWFILNRKFIQYLTMEKDDLVTGLFDYFENSLLPAETFFHTLIQNSRFCLKPVINSNLHFINWQTETHRGCHCKHSSVVGWCGCSPIVITSFDWPKLQLLMNEDPPNFFARKFDRSIDSDIFSMMLNTDNTISTNHNQDDICWWNFIGSERKHKNYRFILNFYSSKHDKNKYWRISIGLLELVRSKLAREFIGNSCLMEAFDPKYWWINIYGLFNSTDKGLGSVRSFLLSAQIHNTFTLTTAVSYIGRAGRLTHFKNEESENKYTILQLLVSQDYDVKENIFHTPPFLLCSDKPFTLEIQISYTPNHKPLQLSLFALFIDPQKQKHSFKLPPFQIYSITSSSNVFYNSDTGIYHIYYERFDIDEPLPEGLWRILIYTDMRFQKPLANSWFQVGFQDSSLLKNYRFITKTNSNNEGYCVSVDKSTPEYRSKCQKEEISSNLICPSNCNHSSMFDFLLPSNL